MHNTGLITLSREDNDPLLVVLTWLKPIHSVQISCVVCTQKSPDGKLLVRTILDRWNLSQAIERTGIKAFTIFHIEYSETKWFNELSISRRLNVFFPFLFLFLFLSLSLSLSLTNCFVKVEYVQYWQGDMGHLLLEWQPEKHRNSCSRIIQYVKRVGSASSVSHWYYPCRCKLVACLMPPESRNHGLQKISLLLVATQENNSRLSDTFWNFIWKLVRIWYHFRTLLQHRGSPWISTGFCHLHNWELWGHYPVLWHSAVRRIEAIERIIRLVRDTSNNYR